MRILSDLSSFRIYATKVTDVARLAPPPCARKVKLQKYLKLCVFVCIYCSGREDLSDDRGSIVIGGLQQTGVCNVTFCNVVIQPPADRIVLLQSFVGLDKLPSLFDDRDMNAIDDIRRQIGLTKVGMLKLLSAEDEGESIFRDPIPDPEFAERAVYLAELHEQFKVMLKRRLADELDRPAFAVKGEPCLSTKQVSEVLGIGEFHVSNLQDRGKLNCFRYGRWPAYPRRAVEELIDRGITGPALHSPLAKSFASWVEAEGFLGQLV